MKGTSWFLRNETKKKNTEIHNISLDKKKKFSYNN